MVGEVEVEAGADEDEEGVHKDDLAPCQGRASLDGTSTLTEDQLLPGLHHRQRKSGLDPEPLAPDVRPDGGRGGLVRQTEIEENLCGRRDMLPGRN